MRAFFLYNITVEYTYKLFQVFRWNNKKVKQVKVFIDQTIATVGIGTCCTRLNYNELHSYPANFILRSYSFGIKLIYCNCTYY